MITNSSVAREGGAIAPHWPEEYAQYSVFSTFEANFCSKNKNSPPPLDLAMKIGHGTDVNSTRKTELHLA